MGLKGIFSFGGWNAHRMCFKCRATQEDGDVPYTDVSASALWRVLRTTAAAFVADMRAKGIDLSPLLSLPGFVLEYLIIDVLHCMDLGVSQDVSGSLMYELVHAGHWFLSGYSAANRVQDLWAKIRTKYKHYKTPNRLQALTHEMIV